MNSIFIYIKRVFLTIAIPAILFLLIRIAYPERIGFDNLVVIFLQAIPAAVLAWGLSFDIKVGVWDFSIGATVLISGILGGNIANLLGWGIPGVILFCSLIGFCMGIINGTLFRVLKIPSIIITIGMMLIVESVCSQIFNGRGVLMSSEILAIGKFPLNIIIGILAFALAYYLYNFRKFGFHVRAVGNGLSIAMMNGIKVANVKTLCFATAGLFAGFFAFLQLGNSGVMKAQMNMTTMGVVFDALICVFIALSLEKYTNMIIGVFIGSLTTQVIKLAILVTGFPSVYQQVVIALFVLLFMGLSEKGKDIRKAFAKLKMKTNLNIND